MQQIAAETNYSETTFVKSVPEDDGGYRVRIFTPAREIAFAGHPILGTAWVVRYHVAPGCAKTRRWGMGRRSSAHTTWSIASSLAPIYACGSSKDTRFGGLPWLCCELE